MNAPAIDTSARRLCFGGRDWLILAGFAALILVVFADPVLTGRVFHYRDFSRFFYPNYYYAAQRLRAGELPLWDPHCFCGHPFMGSWYPAALYPLSVIYIALPFEHALTAFVVFHSYLALAMMYLLIRDLGCGRLGAAAGAATFGLSGFALSVVDNPNTLTSLAWMPLVFLLVRRVMGRPSAGRVMAAGAAIALQVYAGGPEMVYCTWLLTGLYGLAKVIDGRRTAADRGVWRARLAGLAGTFVLGGLFAAFQLLPFAEVLSQSPRSRGYGIVESGFWHVPVRDLWRFLVPDLMTNRTPMEILTSEQRWLKSFYLGLVPLVLAGMALVGVRGRRTLFFVGAGVLGVLFAFGDQSLFWVGAYLVLPGISGIRYPVKFMVLPTFALAVLAGFGANWLVTAAPRSRRRALLVACLAVLLALVAAGAAALAIERARAARMADTGGPIHPADTPTVEAYGITLRSLGRTAVVLAAMSVCLGWLAATQRPRMGKSGDSIPGLRSQRGDGRRMRSPDFPARLGRSAPWAGAALGLVLLADTVHHHRPQIFTAHPRVYRIRPASMDVIERLPPYSRVFIDHNVFEWARAAYLTGRGDADPLALLRELHTHNLPLLTGSFNVYGFVPVRPWRFHLLYDRLRQRGTHTKPIIDFLNVTLALHAERMIGSAHLDAVRFEENADALPRATIVRHLLRDPLPVDGARDEEATGDLAPTPSAPASRRGRPAQTRDERAISWLTSRLFDPRREVYLDKEPPPLPSAPAGPPAERDQVTITTYEPERVVLAVESTAPGYLVMADQYFPGWRATVNGRRAEIAPANFCFRAVAVPAGTFTVEMVYRPWTAPVGLALTLAAGAAAFAWLAAARLRRRRRGAAP